MPFKKLLASLGVGSAEVETVLDDPDVTPGTTLQGVVHIKGGNVQQEIEQLDVALVAKAEVETGDGEHDQHIPFHAQALTGKFTLQPGQKVSTPFSLQVPWETPITVAYGARLRGMLVGVATQLEIEHGVDSTDIDPIVVRPLPPQERILEALYVLGFQLHRADVETGQVLNTGQTLPFYQEIEFYPPAQYRHGINEVEVTFFASASRLEVVLELDKRGRFGGGHDSIERLEVDSATYAQVSWEQELGHLLTRAAQRRGFTW